MRPILVLAVVVSLVGAGCGDEDAAEPAGSAPALSSDVTEVTAADIAFEPTSLEFEPGGTITLALINDDTTEHSLTSESTELPFDVEAEPGASAEAEIALPDQPGTFPFFCRYHPDAMQLELIIGGGGEAPVEEQGEDTGEGSEENDDGY